MKNKLLDDDQKKFPLAGQPGSPIEDILSEVMRGLAESAEPMRGSELEKIIRDHQLFISDGGIGGRWETFIAGGLIIGIYVGVSGLQGQQADLHQRKLNGFSLNNLELPASNFLGVIAESVDFRNSNLSHCLFTDSYLKQANFEGANLSYSDFSRSGMQGCNFKNADLQGADFENCDCSDADFTGANLTGSRFPGANLSNVKI
jgi:uncharacterized protein YjbI with pentapeptide repeats